MKDFKILRILLAIIAATSGLIMTLGGINGIITIISGGTINIPISKGSYSEAIPMGGFLGFINALFYLILGIWMLKAVLKSRLGTKIVKPTMKPTITPPPHPYCRWWQDEKDNWHREENPLFTSQYPKDGICPQCGKTIEIITEQIYQ